MVGTLARPMEIVLSVILAVFSLAVCGLVMYLFVWAARKDGEEDRAVQRKLGIRRKTRLGL